MGEFISKDENKKPILFRARLYENLLAVLQESVGGAVPGTWDAMSAAVEKITQTKIDAAVSRIQCHLKSMTSISTIQYTGLPFEKHDLEVKNTIRRTAI
jgi:hypothetical protein